MSHDKYYARRIEIILRDSEIGKGNLEILKKYYSHGKIQQITIGSQSARLGFLRLLAIFVKKDFKDVTKEDIEKYFSSKGELASKTWSSMGATIKSFFRWLYNSDEYPSNVSWIKTTVKDKNRVLPSELLKKDEIKAMVKAANHPMEKAFIMVLYESACRIGEILNLKIKDVTIDRYGSVIMVDGKTGMRRIRLIESTPDLVLWINNHPKNKERDSPLFIRIYNPGSEFEDSTANNLIRRLAKKAGIDKRLHAHLFRHSRLTELARDFSESELKVMAGWTGSSTMAGVYIHLTGGDIEKKILEKNGLLDKFEDPLKDILKPAICPHCKGTNPNTALFCYVCGMVLKDGVEKKILENDKQNKEIVEGEHSELREPKADDVLSKGFLQFVVKSHPELVYEFFKENGLDDLLPPAFRKNMNALLME